MKAGRWIRIGLSDPREFFDRLQIAREGRAEPSGPASEGVLATLRSLPAEPRALVEMLGGAAGAVSDDEAFRIQEDWMSFWAGLDFRAGHDADPALVRTVYFACRIFCPSVVVETGVGRGLSTVAVLAALDRNDRGRLISIDLPPLADPWFSASAELVSDDLRDRWDYRRGSVRRVLPKVLEELSLAGERIDVHIADSLHTSDHIDWEVRQVQPSMTSSGIQVIDDVATWVGRHRSSDGALGFSHELKDGCFAVLRRGR